VGVSGGGDDPVCGGWGVQLHVVGGNELPDRMIPLDFATTVGADGAAGDTRTTPNVITHWSPLGVSGRGTSLDEAHSQDVWDITEHSIHPSGGSYRNEQWGGRKSDKCRPSTVRSWDADRL